MGGVELIRRARRAEAFGVTLPLLTARSGEKIGKSAGNALWVDQAPLELYQHLLNLPDEDAACLLPQLTFSTLEECQAIAEDPRRDLRLPQRHLADSL